MAHSSVPVKSEEGGEKENLVGTRLYWGSDGVSSVNYLTTIYLFI